MKIKYKLSILLLSTALTAGAYGIDPSFVGSYWSIEYQCEGLKEAEFLNLTKKIKAISYEDEKLTLIKKIVPARCLKVVQIKQLLYLLEFEDSRLDVAKFFYAYTLDQDEFDDLFEVFEFQSSVNDLKDFIKSKPTFKKYKHDIRKH